MSFSRSSGQALGSPDSDSNPDSGSNPSGKKVEAFLGKGCVVSGTLTFEGPVEIDGSVEGEIAAKDILLIGETAQVKAKIQGAEVVVKGTVQGDIIASRKLALKKPAKVHGNLKCSVLSIEEGVIFVGNCAMERSTMEPSTMEPSTMEPSTMERSTTASNAPSIASSSAAQTSQKPASK